MTNSFGYGDLNTFGSFFETPVEYDFGGEINFKYNPVNDSYNDFSQAAEAAKLYRAAANSGESESQTGLQKAGQIARDLNPVLQSIGALVEKIKGVPPGQQRFAGIAQAQNLDLIAKSLGYANAREFIEATSKPAPIKEGKNPKPSSVIKPDEEKPEPTPSDTESGTIEPVRLQVDPYDGTLEQSGEDTGGMRSSLTDLEGLNAMSKILRDRGIGSPFPS